MVRKYSRPVRIICYYIIVGDGPNHVQDVQSPVPEADNVAILGVFGLVGEGQGGGRTDGEAGTTSSTGHQDEDNQTTRRSS